MLGTPWEEYRIAGKQRSRTFDRKSDRAPSTPRSPVGANSGRYWQPSSTAKP
jgi:hypothetical protein